MIAIVLLGLAGLGCVLHGIAALRLARFLKAGAPSGQTLPPVTFWRALKAGVPDLESKLEALASAVRNGDQIVVGIDLGSGELALCARWRARHAGLDIEIVKCEPHRAPNPKISKLLQMRPRARHERWLLTDSEAVLTRDFADAIRADWERTGADVLTAGYRFAGMRTPLQWLDTLPAALTLWPGLMLVPRLTFTLGACTALRAADVGAIGGWEALGDELAEDHSLGQRLSADGKKIVLSRAVLELHTDPLGRREYLRHQHRLAVTYRAANPAGFAGLPIFHVLPLVLAAAILHPPLWPWALLGAVMRTIAGCIEARLLRMSSPLAVLLIPCTLLFEGFFWLAAWLPLPVWWAGRWRRITWRGTFQQEPA